MDEKLVYTVDDDSGFRKSLKTLLETSGYTVRDFDNGESFLAEFNENDAGCVILDLRMPGMGGVLVQNKLVDDGFRVPVIIVTAYATVPVTVEAMRRGAVTVLEKPYDPTVLLQTVENAMTNQRIDLTLDWKVVERRYSLSPRQREIAELICDSKSNEEIASDLGITTNTVRMHVKLLYEKLGVHDRVGVAMKLLQPSRNSNANA